MLSSEQAQQSLASYRDSDFKQNQVKRLRGLKGNLSTIGQIMIQAGPAWDESSRDTQKRNKVFNETCDQFCKLPAGDRQKIFSALFPKLSPYVESTWNLFDHLPYQCGFARRPFRNPDHFSPTARLTWLINLVRVTTDFDQEVTWYAIWAPYLGYLAPESLGYLFAGTIESGGNTGQQVFDILVASANGSHEIGAMGRHVVRGLLCASRQDGWEHIERMLLAAQREEGLRQVILESIDEAQPQAFSRMLRLILEQNLCRFSAAIRAFDVWFGLALENVSQKTIHELLEKVADHLDSPQNCEQAIAHGSAEEVYFALWSMAFEDIVPAMRRAIEIRQSTSAEHRFVATHFLTQVRLVGSFNELVKTLDDPNLQVAALAAMDLSIPNYNREMVGKSDQFERMERLIERLPHKENNLKPLVWDWFPLRLNREYLCGSLVHSLGNRSPKVLIPYLSKMDPSGRARAAELFVKIGEDDAETRQLMFTLAGDPSSYVREKALKALQAYTLTTTEIEQVEDFLTRKADDLRQGVMRLLLGMPDALLLQSVRRLLEKKNADQRRAGLELLKEAVQSNRSLPAFQSLAKEYLQKGEPTDSESNLLESILAEDVQQYTLADALGLMNPLNRTRPKVPWRGSLLPWKAGREKLGSNAALAILQALDALVEEHRGDPVEMIVLDTKRTELLGNIQYGFPAPNPSLPFDQNLALLPLRDIWEKWWQNRPPALRDPDGCELLRALALSCLFVTDWKHFIQGTSEVPDRLQGFFDVSCKFKLRYLAMITSILKWLVWLHPVQGEVAFLVNSLEISFSRIPDNELKDEKPPFSEYLTRAMPQNRLAYLNICRWHRSLKSTEWMDEHHARLWAAVRWMDEPRPGLSRMRPLLEDILFAYQAGAATPDDLLEALLNPDNINAGGDYNFLRQLSGRKPHPYFETYPDLKRIFEECRERILSIEIHRGDLPTAATRPARSLRSIPGVKNLFRLLAALENTDFDRSLSGNGRAADLSHLIVISYSEEEDTPEVFSQLAQKYEISERRLVELAVLAPQWSPFIEKALAWPLLSQAAFWVHAHTKDRQWMVDKEIQELWIAQVSEFTSLSADSLMDGAVDVDWFHQIYATLGEKRWNEVYRAAVLAAGGNGHMRSRIFADAMLGKVSAAELINRIKKRHQDSIRALGLIPLPDGEDRRAEVLRRYEVMQEFLRTSRKFGSQRQASEKLAVSIGMENLARTAGYADPQRLEWAMEIQAVADLAIGPVTVKVGETTVTLSITDLGDPELAVSKNGKKLNSIPAAVKKEESISGLMERKQKLARQASRMRQSLETAMVRGDLFSGAEIGELFNHPILRSMLEQLILIPENEMGYPVESGKALYTHSGATIPIAQSDQLRIAHPVDLLASGEWHRWQRECFIAERIQPFKQVFRELYTLTSTEKDEGNLTRRYAGQQVNPRQAVGLFGARGWVINPEEGVHKTFHELGICARVGFLEGAFTPAEVEGLTLEGTLFTRRGEWTPIRLEQVPARIFSEVMRDLDLVVSVAHAGGVDPEASASSIEARSALVQETCSLLHLPNVEIKNNHALVNGKLANYTIHLGSAVVHKQPGMALCIVPIHSQQRGRLFLPFVDQDPKTAEVVSKVILLARDNEIKDPTILEQIL